MASFKESFAAARKAKKKTFTWNGKRYTTELASSKKSGSSTYGKKTQDPSSALSAMVKKKRGSAPSSSAKPKARAQATSGPKTRPGPAKKKNEQRKGEELGMQRRMASASDSSAPSKSKKPKSRTSSGGSFNSAFAAARKRGAASFTWKGKKYNTKRK